MKQMTVVGAGTMGNGIAHVFSVAGYTVQLIDTADAYLERAMKQIELNLARQVKKEVLNDEQAAGALARIHPGTSLVVAKDAELVIEAASEDASIKKSLFAELAEAAATDTILATNTSSISITEIAASTSCPDRVIGMHFFNPVPVMKLVEVIRGLATSDTTFESVMRISRNLGKTPVAVNDYPGFVSNRVLMPMINEAVFCVMEGVAGSAEVDEVMKLGMAHPMGPLALADLIGLDVCLHIMEVLHRDLGDDKYRPCPLLRKMVAAGHLGKKSGQGFYSYN
jgi:3-hydroxybutyryl-CoA dehydrogenase